eukprot:6199714-Pleurochrysis_carterae.AAC.5
MQPRPYVAPFRRLNNAALGVLRVGLNAELASSDVSFSTGGVLLQTSAPGADANYQHAHR